MKLIRSLSFKTFSTGLFIFGIFFSRATPSFNLPMNFVTVSDTEHYPWLITQIRSLKKYNPGKEINLIVFDIGLSSQQIKFLNSYENVKVRPIEMTHPDLTKKFVVRENGRLARGWYAWKPVAIKQAFDHFDYFLYMDAAIRVVGPTDDIFYVITQQGYFLIDCGHRIHPMTTHRVKSKFGLNYLWKKWILHEYGISAGLQGLSKKVYEEYVLPMYQLAHDITWFEDDGTAPWGFGGSRHDQPLFSIYARLNGYKAVAWRKDEVSFIEINGEKIRFNHRKYFGFKHFRYNPAAAKNKLRGPDAFKALATDCDNDHFAIWDWFKWFYH